ncbi:MAG: alpha/beta hydrolase fold domain-containing protein [Paludibacteraceae bacterium]|nr:alpha/beta hydrolase fold domain-containing protein [Paludibacteraceae bacterium]
MKTRPACIFFITLFFLLSASAYLSAQVTYAFAERDTVLHLDVYQPKVPNGYTVIHIFGGGFIGGYRQNKWDADYCRQLADSGYTAVAIDYRLGLRGIKNVGFGTISAIERAILMAVEDCADAVAFLVNNADKTGVNPQKIILEGSSAGAITALMTDYARCNSLSCAAALPADWSPAAVVAYSGAVFSSKGKVSWDNAAPAPTLLFHGTADRIVNYKQLQLGRTGLYGANALVKRFEKYGYPYCIYRYTSLGHEVSVGGPVTIDELNMFVKQYITDHKPLHTDITQTNDSIPPSEFSKHTLRDLYKPQKRKDL